jgi:hypothetical protein
MAQTILYYPTIDIQDGKWLRNAVIYWDKVASIVPYDNYPNFSPEILYLQERELYEPIFPQNLFYSKYATDFVNAITIDTWATDDHGGEWPDHYTPEEWGKSIRTRAEATAAMEDNRGLLR